MKENIYSAFIKKQKIEEAKMFKKLRLALFYISGAGIVLVFGSLMAILEMEIPKIIIMALTVGISLIISAFVIKLLIVPFVFGGKDEEKEVR